MTTKIRWKKYIIAYHVSSNFKVLHMLSFSTLPNISNIYYQTIIQNYNIHVIVHLVPENIWVTLW